MTNEVLYPCDWDFESYCMEEGCHAPATHRRLDSMVGDAPIYEMVCCLHSIEIIGGSSES